MRVAGIAATIAALLIAHYGFDAIIPYGYMTITLLAIGLVAAISCLRVRTTWQISEREVFLQLTFDVAGLVVLLYLSGGATNPFVSLLLLPVIITATLLPSFFCWLMVVLTVFAYSLLLFWYVPLNIAQHPMDGAAMIQDMSHDMAPGFRLHILGMWVNFLLSALLIATVTVRMMATIRSQDKLLAIAREDNLRHEKIIAVGTLAAGAAHELGTPLSTIAILCSEMQQDAESSPQLKENLDIIRTQVGQCKETLAALLANADSSRPVRGERMALDNHLKRIIDKCLLVRPNVHIKDIVLVNNEELAPPLVYFDQTLDQALINLLNNAADASPDNVEVELKWDKENASITFRDLGPGLSQEVFLKAGKAFFTSKSQGKGLGIGLYLANATIERFGGKVHLFNQDNGGAVIQVVLPLRQLETQDIDE